MWAFLLSSLVLCVFMDQLSHLDLHREATVQPRHSSNLQHSLDSSNQKEWKFGSMYSLGCVHLSAALLTVDSALWGSSRQQKAQRPVFRKLALRAFVSTVWVTGMKLFGKSRLLPASVGWYPLKVLSSKLSSHSHCWLSPRPTVCYGREELLCHSWRIPQVHSGEEGVCRLWILYLLWFVFLYIVFFFPFFIFPYFLIGSAHSVTATNLWVLRQNPLLLGLSPPARSSDVTSFKVSDNTGILRLEEGEFAPS